MGPVIQTQSMPDSPHPSIPSPEGEGRIVGIGAMDSEPNIRNKLSRGKFIAVFLIQCLEAIGASSLRLSD